VTQRILPLDPATYQRHALHGEGRLWTETNCSVDVWVELLHAFGHEPIAALPFTLAIDFEGDQWTFFKFPPGDLFELFGADVQELAIRGRLDAHLEEQVARGRPVLIELDARYLPDTAGTSYRSAHVKSTAGVIGIDVHAQQLIYFHNQSLHQLHGDDFVDALKLREPIDPASLPPYTEFVKLRSAEAQGDDDIVKRSIAMLRKHLALAPADNPFVPFKARLQAELPALLAQDLEEFHQYSFATWRMFGASYELAATYLRWLGAHGEPGLEACADEFQTLAELAKAAQFQLARAITRRKTLDLSTVDAMAEHWDRGIGGVRSRYL